MIKRSDTDKNTVYVRLPFVHLIFWKGKYLGWRDPRLSKVI